MIPFLQIAVSLVLLMNPILSFTTISSNSKVAPRRTSASQQQSSIETRHDSSAECYPALGRISLSSSPLLMARERFYDDYDDDEYYYEDEEKEMDDDADYYSDDMPKGRTTDDYYDDDEDVKDGDDKRGGYYQVIFDEDVDPSETEIDWEVCTSDSGDGKTQALVLLPPAAVERPTAIIHFVGGTFFGSNPKLWYRSLLESIVRSTSAAIIVTPIPVTLFNNPLQHVKLSQKLQKSFNYAWLNVLEDEYGADALKDIPLCGLGHSLGARLLAVLTTLNQNMPMKSDGRRRASTASIPPYKSMCLVSFTNYGAKVGIPGVAALRKQSKKQEQNKRRSRGRKSYSGYDDYDDPDEEWAELVGELQETVTEQASRIQTALTPNSDDLEFVPSPDRLWKAIKADARYKVNTTLVVQFDDDPIDQSSQLAQALHSTNSSDVRFARLRGNHLTPVSVTDETPGESDGARARRRQSSVGKFGAVLEKTIKGNTKSKRDKIAMRDLRLSIISYITDVVTK